ncbi:unnamed protein product [marine sediment metagenome]|uniref:Uncharacterized protein n=1 Tax=marine sediment metagenome TaxID=412755 RepID=X0XC20_9ZZZZ
MPERKTYLREPDARALHLIRILHAIRGSERNLLQRHPFYEAGSVKSKVVRSA